MTNPVILEGRKARKLFRQAKEYPDLSVISEGLIILSQQLDALSEQIESVN